MRKASPARQEKGALKMADMDSTARRNHSIVTNTYATMVFSDSQALSNFTEKTSKRLASMLHVLMEVHQDIDSGFISDILELANDLAFQLQGSVEILANQDANAPALS